MSGVYRRTEVVSGLFILICIVIFTMFAFRVQGLDLFGFARSRGFECRAYFVDAKTLEVGSKVAVAGRRVGSVRSIRLLTQQQDAAQVERLRTADPAAFEALSAGMLRHVVEVDFVVDDGGLRLATDTAGVRLAQDGLLGRHYLALDPGYWTSTAMPARLAEVAIDQPITLVVRQVEGLEDLIGGALPILHRVDRVLARLDEGLFAEANLTRVSTTLDGLSASATALGRLLADDDPRGLRQQVLEPLHALLGQAAAILDARGPDLARLLDNLDKVSGGLEPRLARLEGDLRSLLTRLEADVGTLLASTNGLVTDNRAELAETARRLRRAMWETEMAVRKIRADPSRLLFGDAERDLDEQPVDHTRLDVSGRARPFRQRDEVEAGGK